MRETVNSLRAYFIIAGILSGFFALSVLGSAPNIIATVIALLVLAVDVGFVVVGVRLRAWLNTRQPLIRGLIFASMALQCLPLLLLLIASAPVTSYLLQPILAIVIGLYLLYSVRRLAAQSVKLA